MSQKIEITIDNRPISVDCGTKISEILSIDLPCAGKGKCGKCKVIAIGELSDVCETEQKSLSQAELSSGVRLACQTFVLGKCSILTDVSSTGENRILTVTDTTELELDPCFDSYGVALDIGTTTLAANLYDQNGRLLASASQLNPQGRYGADVISRIEASLDRKADELAQTICTAIDQMINSLCADAQICAHEIDGAVFTGNTAMLYLLTKSSPKALSCAPFIADKYFGECISAQKLGLSSLRDDTMIYLPPCIASFVGADTVCAILASKINEKDTISLLVDIGTNGEMALWDTNKVTVCSTAAGPAFEGVGILHGMRAAGGAIDKVTIANGTLLCHTIGEKEPVGICGSGLIDAVSCLLDLETLDETGYLEDDEVILSGSILLTQQDIRMLQLAKSAIYSGICTLMQALDINFEQVCSLYIAGGFGNYLNMKSAVRVGLLPRELLDKIDVIGNAALSGACMLLLNKSLRDKAKTIAQDANYVELSTNPIFSELYMNNMLF